MNCDKCQGDGLIGAGDRPHEKKGNISTCDDCHGTGKVQVLESEPEAVTVPESDETDNEKVLDEEVPEDKGMLGRIIDAVIS